MPMQDHSEISWAESMQLSTPDDISANGAMMSLLMDASPPQLVGISEPSATAKRSSAEEEEAKKAKRREQVRKASSKRRVKKKEEENFLAERIDEVHQQLKLLARNPEEECFALMNYTSEEKLLQIYQQKQASIIELRKKNLEAAQLLRSKPTNLMQSSLGPALTSNFSAMNMCDPMEILPAGVPIVLDIATSRELISLAINEIQSFSPTPGLRTQLVYDLGWKIQLWPVNACMHALGVRSCDLEVERAVDATWDLLTSSSPEKFRKVFPEVRFVRILQRVTEDIVVIQRLALVPSDPQPREFLSLAFRHRIDSSFFIGLMSLPSAMLHHEMNPRCIRGEELRGWMFSHNLNPNESAWPWNLQLVSRYDIKGDGSKQLWDDLANDAIANMRRWESEATDFSVSCDP